jgi:uncharacterized UBP type Zn finger protein
MEVWGIAESFGIEAERLKKITLQNQDNHQSEEIINIILDLIQQEEDNCPPYKEEPFDDGNRNYTIKSGVVHLGQSIEVGHYVSYVKENSSNKWIYINDDQCYRTEDTKVGQSYLLTLEKKI